MKSYVLLSLLFNQRPVHIESAVFSSGWIVDGKTINKTQT